VSDEHDVAWLAGLQSAWRSIPPPDPTAPVDAPDAETRASVEWLSAAWRAAASHAPAPSTLPARLRARLLRRRAAAIAPWLAAAAALVLGITWFARSERTPSPPIELASEHSATVEPPLAPRSAGPESGEPKLVTLTADRMELRSGPVRLILFTPSQESNR
jgi:hypothetical protein